MLKRLINWLVNGPKQCGNCKHMKGRIKNEGLGWCFQHRRFKHSKYYDYIHVTKRDTCAKWEPMR